MPQSLTLIRNDEEYLILSLSEKVTGRIILTLKCLIFLTFSTFTYGFNNNQITNVLFSGFSINGIKVDANGKITRHAAVKESQ